MQERPCVSGVPHTVAIVYKNYNTNKMEPRSVLLTRFHFIVL